MAHPALYIPELLKAIFLFLSPRKKWLSHCAMTCHQWTPVALEMMWTDLPSIRPLVALLPWTYATTPVNKAVLDIFDQYADRVRTIGQVDIRRQSAAFIAIAKMRRRRIVFPRLRAMSVVTPIGGIEPDVYILSPQLRTIYIDNHYIGNDASFCVVSALSTQARLVKSLSITGQLHTRCLRDIASLSNLQVLNLIIGTTTFNRSTRTNDFQEFFKTISVLPHLRELNLPDHFELEDIPLSAAPGFRALQILKAFISPLVVVQMITAFSISTLEKVIWFYLGTRPTSIPPVTASDVEALFNTMRSYCGISLRELFLYSMIPTSTAAVTPLLFLRGLRVVRLGDFFPIHSSDLKSMAQSWPGLTSIFCQSGCDAWALVHLAEYCPNLTDIFMSINSVPHIIDDDTPLFEQGKVKRLTLGVLPSINWQILTCLIGRLFPCLQFFRLEDIDLRHATQSTITMESLMWRALMERRTRSRKSTAKAMRQRT